MTTNLVVRKQLATQEDLLLGVGEVVQTRNGVDYTLNKIPLIAQVADLVELDTLDVELYKFAMIAGISYSWNGLVWVRHKDNALSTLFTPAGSLSSEDVQLAIEELDANTAKLDAPATFSGPITISHATAPTLSYIEEDAALDEKQWQVIVDSTEYQLQVLDDLGAFLSTPFKVSRAGVVTATQFVGDGSLLTGVNLPVGAVLSSLIGVLPETLEADGAVISRATYANLFAVIGELYGIGDGSTTFQLPDLRGEFLRGLDNGRGIDIGRVEGSFQADEFASHRHNISNGGSAHNVGLASGPLAKSSTGNVTNTNAVQLNGGTETRPRNMPVTYCVTY